MFVVVLSVTKFRHFVAKAVSVHLRGGCGLSPSHRVHRHDTRGRDRWFSRVVWCSFMTDCLCISVPSGMVTIAHVVESLICWVSWRCARSLESPRCIILSKKTSIRSSQRRFIQELSLGQESVIKKAYFCSWVRHVHAYDEQDTIRNSKGSCSVITANRSITTTEVYVRDLHMLITSFFLGHSFVLFSLWIFCQ